MLPASRARSPFNGQSFFGAEWRPSILLVQILSLGFPFDAPAWVAGALLAARGEFRKALVYSFVGGVSFMALIAIGAAYAAAMGVAIAVSFYYLIYGPAYTYGVVKSGLNVWRFMGEVFVLAPGLSGLAFGVAYLAAEALCPSGANLLRAIVLCLVGSTGLCRPSCARRSRSSGRTSSSDSAG